uniref:N-acetylneuraminate lyase n=1 Tax=Glossina brevipalpis TaxID=37001 RepID=A0A1A9WKF1_9MUSC
QNIGNLFFKNKRGISRHSFLEPKDSLSAINTVEESRHLTKRAIPQSEVPARTEDTSNINWSNVPRYATKDLMDENKVMDVQKGIGRKSVTFFDFKGLMAPVFTCFNDDEQKTINVTYIDRYAKWLKSKNINGVLVNSITGEGPTLGLNERKVNAECWWRAAIENNLVMMLQIGGGPVPDVLEMGSFAEELGVHSVCCLPEIFYKPRSVDQLVAYCKAVAKTCKSRPFFYYHIPRITNVNCK